MIKQEISRLTKKDQRLIRVVDPRTNNPQKGVTSIEILVIVCIISIILGITIPLFQKWQPNLRLKTAAKEVVSDLHYIQELALSEQINYGIHFSSKTNYQLIKIYPDQTEEILKEKTLPSGIKFQEINGLDNNKVIFNSIGAVKESGQIILVNIKNKTITIDIRPSGFIRQE